MAEKITPRQEDYSRWYLDVIREAELAENSPVRGCMVIRPYGYALWEAVRDGLDRRFKATGHVNAYFPLCMLDVYADFAINDAAIPVIKGRKSDRERFAGAVDTYAIEAMMGNGWALQSGTSHYLGTNFAKAFEINYLDRNNVKQLCHTTS